MTTWLARAYKRFEARFVDPETVAFADLADEVFRRSKVLQRLGYMKATRTLQPEGERMHARCSFAFDSGPHRTVDIWLSNYKNSRCYVIVEIFNTKEKTSFLLEEWMKLHGVEDTLDHFNLSSDGETPRERLEKFAAFLEKQFSGAALFDVLKGRLWVDIPYDWGNLK